MVYFGKVLRYNYLCTSSNFLFGFTVSVVLTSTLVDVFDKSGTGGGELGWEFCKGILGETWLVDGDDFFLKLNEICSYDILKIWWPLECHAIFRDGLVVLQSSSTCSAAFIARGLFPFYFHFAVLVCYLSCHAMFGKKLGTCEPPSQKCILRDSITNIYVTQHSSYVILFTFQFLRACITL